MIVDPILLSLVSTLDTFRISQGGRWDVADPALWDERQTITVARVDHAEGEPSLDDTRPFRALTWGPATDAEACEVIEALGLRLVGRLSEVVS